MIKNLFLALTMGVVLVLVACGNESESSSSVEGVLGDYGAADDDGYSNGEQEPLGVGDRECVVIRVADSGIGIREFFELHNEIMMGDYLGDLDAFLNARIDNYTGLFYSGSGEYVILIADDLENWQAPDLLADVNFTICRAEYSYDELSAIRTQIDNNHTNTSVARITGWGIDALENRVLVNLAELTDEAILDFRENVSDSDLIEFSESRVVFEATIQEIYDEPPANWYGEQMTVLVTSEEFGRMVFDHRRLEDIGATVGDVIELTIAGDWVQPDPQPVYPDSWRLVD